MKKYHKPNIKEVLLDKIVILQNTSKIDQEGLPWDAPTDSGTSTTSTETTEEPLKDNNFEDNPFER